MGSSNWARVFPTYLRHPNGGGVGLKPRQGTPKGGIRGGGEKTSPAQRSGYPYGVGSSETKC